MLRRIRLWSRKFQSGSSTEDSSSHLDDSVPEEPVAKGSSKLTFNEVIKSKPKTVTLKKTVGNGFEFKTVLESHKNPEEVQGITLCHTRVEYIPVTIGQFSSLTVLELKNNLIMEMPWSIIFLKHLEILDLSSNSLTELPPIIGYLAALNKLILNDNQLTFLPTSLLKLAKLDILEVTGNNEMRSPPMSICSQGKDAIFTELFRRHNRVNVLAGSTPWYNEDCLERQNNGYHGRIAVDSLMKIAIDCILECQVDYLSPVYVPPPLKTFLQTTEETKSKEISICACSECKGFFSTELLFDTHFCIPRDGQYVSPQ